MSNYTMISEQKSFRQLLEVIWIRFCWSGVGSCWIEWELIEEINTKVVKTILCLSIRCTVHVPEWANQRNQFDGRFYRIWPLGDRKPR